MLPDYPKVKERLRRALFERMKQVQSERLGVLSGVKETFIQEGRRSTLRREDGSVQDAQIKPIEVSQLFDVDYQALEDLKLSDILRFFDRMAIALADAKAGHTLEVLTAELEKVGNVESSKSPIHEKLLSGFEKMEFEFVDGLPIMPSFVANPTTRPPIEKALQHIFETPDLNRRFRAIMHEKRERHRDREAARKLVE